MQLLVSLVSLTSRPTDRLILARLPSLCFALAIFAAVAFAIREIQYLVFSISAPVELGTKRRMRNL